MMVGLTKAASGKTSKLINTLRIDPVNTKESNNGLTVRYHHL